MSRTSVVLLVGFWIGLDLPAVRVPASEWLLDERPCKADEWGFRPAEGTASAVNPPAFVWRPEKRGRSYDLEVSRDEQFERPAYAATGLELYAHCPDRVFEPGRWYWRFRGVDASGVASAWSTTRSFTVPQAAAAMPLPAREELLARVPRSHPRLFLRPEELPGLKDRVRSDLAAPLEALVRRCDKLLQQPPPTAEPQKYPPGMVRKSEGWRELWWGNRVYTINVLDSAATLAFVRLVSGEEKYGQLARRLLLDAARWDPTGATGYRYNDEAGMPYAYHFSRTYTFLHDLLSEPEREICRGVMRVRGREMYDHLRPMHIWRPYNSHANRAWHFLGEVGVAFHGEIPEAGDWVWFAANVFHCSYPVWSDDDGGWHEGMAYWRSYIDRFTWWADVMRSALGIDAYRKPYFSQIGFLPMYMQPPGTAGGGFGDLAGRLESAGNVPLMQTFAGQAGNPYWQWYVEAHGNRTRGDGYIGLLRGALPRVEPKAPADLPSSRCFRGTGVAVLNTDLTDGTKNIQLMFKSSPFGTQSHGYDANNAFMLYVRGKPLFISSGWRDIYGSDHHSQWMWHTKSTNSITVDGQGQQSHSSAGQGRILEFATGRGFDFVSGEAGGAYGGKLSRFTRSILFVKPSVIVIHDRLEAPEPARFEWWLHAPVPLQVEDHRVNVRREDAGCEVEFLAPSGLGFAYTDRFDPPPRPRVKLTEYHLTARTAAPDMHCDFITVLRPHGGDERAPGACRLVEVDGGWAVEASLATGRAVVLLARRAGATVTHGALSTSGQVAAVVLDEKGATLNSFGLGRAGLKELPPSR